MLADWPNGNSIAIGVVKVPEQKGLFRRNVTKLLEQRKLEGGEVWAEFTAKNSNLLRMIRGGIKVMYACPYGPE